MQYANHVHTRMPDDSLSWPQGDRLQKDNVSEALGRHMEGGNAPKINSDQLWAPVLVFVIRTGSSMCLPKKGDTSSVSKGKGQLAMILRY